MARIFLSHSKRDKTLVDNVSILLSNIGHGPIAEELLPVRAKDLIPSKEVTKKLKESDAVFVFLTENVVKTAHTRNWIMFENGLAAAGEKRVFLFERKGTSIRYPIPYVTDYMLFDPDSTEDLLNIQKLSRIIDSKKRRNVFPLLTGSQASIVSDGKNVEIVSGLTELVISLSDGSIAQKRTIRCSKCNETFRYWSPWIASFSCPCCRNPTNLER